MLLFNQNRRKKCGSGREREGGHRRVPPRCVVPLLDLVHGRGTSSHPRASVRFRFLLGTGKASPGAETREGLSGERSLVPLVLGPSASTTPSHPFAFFSILLLPLLTRLVPFPSKAAVSGSDSANTPKSQPGLPYSRIQAWMYGYR